MFKKQFSSLKTAYYAQVEAMSLMKKDNETVRHFALRVQQLVKKGWCNESAATINLENNEIFTKGLPKKLKDLAHKRQVKHVSTLLEPSIPFHTLVRHVDSDVTYNPTTTSPPVNMVQSVVPPSQNIPIQQDTFINTSASIPEPMKLFDGLDNSYIPEEYLQQVEQDSPLS